MTIPIDTKIATNIFLLPSFNLLSVTLEHKTPTKITDKMLQDLTMIVNGKLTMYIASVLVIDEKNIINPQIARFLEGITVLD
jgi:hypothetical protein